MVIKSVHTCKLKKKDIIQICKLKNSYWNFGLKSNLRWFKKNVKKNDINNLIYLKKKIIGYTLFRKRTVIINKKKIKYLYFDTLIIDKKFRKKKLSNYLMYYNNNLILKLDLHSFLICNNSMVNFYKKYLWHKLKNNKFKIMDHIKSIKFKNSKLNGMTFNFKQMKKEQNYYINK